MQTFKEFLKETKTVDPDAEFEKLIKLKSTQVIRGGPRNGSFLVDIPDSWHRKHYMFDKMRYTIKSNKFSLVEIDDDPTFPSLIKSAGLKIGKRPYILRDNRYRFD